MLGVPLYSQLIHFHSFLKSYSTQYVKLSEETQHGATAPCHNVTEHSLTEKRKLKAKCVANESSTPSQQSLLQQESPVNSATYTVHNSPTFDTVQVTTRRLEPRRSIVHTFPQLELAIL